MMQDSVRSKSRLARRPGVIDSLLVAQSNSVGHYVGLSVDS